MFKEILTEGKGAALDDDAMDTLEDIFANAEQALDDLSDAMNHGHDIKLEYKEKDFQKRWDELKQFFIASAVTN